VVSDAWDFEGLWEIQNHYCSVMEDNLARLLGSEVGGDAMASLARISLEGFHAAFAQDPLLPQELLPNDYQGKRAFELHRKLFAAIGERLPTTVPE